jgi:hypothetical protein
LVPIDYFDYVYEGDIYRCGYFVSADKIFVSVVDMKVGAVAGRVEPRVARILAHELLVQRSFASSVLRQAILRQRGGFMTIEWALP